MDTYPVLDLSRIALTVRTQYHGRTGSRTLKAFDDFKCGSFTCAIGSEDSEDLGIANLEGDIVYSGKGTKLLDQALNLYDWFHIRRNYNIGALVSKPSRYPLASRAKTTYER